ncbi:MAG: hypothetical protein MR630_12130 [Selenomonas sp.]|uniref:hypothetical protein n=1 Tax=Selenomonas sp. TaxID=2053611 RepID=UPI0025E41842|nr:hypothetical protein [Selenomonas sp.]MCI6233339.1 hypothetical protein [Selenomonas sp.]
MANIYEMVDAYYDQHPIAESAAPQELVEQYFRRRAWKGDDFDDMKVDWDLIMLSIEVVTLYDLFSLDTLQPEELRYVVGRYFAMYDVAHPTEQDVQNVFGILKRFLLFLFPKEKSQIEESIADALRGYYPEGPGGAFQMPELVEPELFSFSDEDGDDEEELSDEAFEHLDQYINEFLEAFQNYYRSPVYRFDVQRALYLFFGPMWMRTELALDEEAMQQQFRVFWDFFMFDYHLMKDDQTPIEHFFEEKDAEIKGDKRVVVRDLLKSRFTIFRIEAVEEDAVVCQDLFSDTMMELPRPEEVPPDYRKMLFYGHMHEEGVMLLNGIISVPATAALQRRIQEEIERLYHVYLVQEPQATIKDFFARHAAAVRHVIEQMTSYAKLRAFAEIELPKPQKKADPKLLERLEASERRLETPFRKLKFSLFEQGLVKRLYRDFCAVRRDMMPPEREDVVLATATLLFAINNLKDVGDMKDFFQLFHTTKDDVEDCLTEYFFSIGNWRPDPRYLSETGFVNLLFDWEENEGPQGKVFET